MNDENDLGLCEFCDDSEDNGIEKLEGNNL